MTKQLAAGRELDALVAERVMGLNIALPETGRQAPWWPLQYTQIPWELADDLLAQ